MDESSRRYNLRDTRKKPQGVLLKQWEVEYAKLISNHNIRIHTETIKTAIHSAFEDGMVEQWRIALKCPLSGQRIKVPARYADCTHIECFDLEAFLRMKTQKNLLVCPICQKEVEKPLANIRIDEYIETVLTMLPDALKVELISDGSFTKVHEELVMVPNVIHDEEPYVQDNNAQSFDVKQDEFEDDGEHITLSDDEDESMEEISIVEMKPVSLMPLNMDMKPEIASSSEPEQIHFGEDQKIQDQHNSTTHKTSQSRKKRVHLDNVSESSVEVNGNSQPKVHPQLKRKHQISYLKANVGLKRAVDGEKHHKCKRCHYATNHKGNLTEHMRTHTGERPFKCQFCKYATAWNGDLIKHIRIHTGEKPFKCRFCKYATARSCHLIQHNPIHTGEKPFKCRLCKYATAQRVNLVNHVRTHTGEKPFKCQFCKYAASQSHHLIRHNRIHTGEKPFKCCFCQYASNDSDHLDRHVRGKHKDALKVDAVNSKKNAERKMDKKSVQNQ